MLHGCSNHAIRFTLKEKVPVEKIVVTVTNILDAYLFTCTWHVPKLTFICKYSPPSLLSICFSKCKQTQVLIFWKSSQNLLTCVVSTKEANKMYFPWTLCSVIKKRLQSSSFNFDLKIQISSLFGNPNKKWSWSRRKPTTKAWDLYFVT